MAMAAAHMHIARAVQHIKQNDGTDTSGIATNMVNHTGMAPTQDGVMHVLILCQHLQWYLILHQHSNMLSQLVSHKLVMTYMLMAACLAPPCVLFLYSPPDIAPSLLPGHQHQTYHSCLKFTAFKAYFNK